MKKVTYVIALFITGIFVFSFYQADEKTEITLVKSKPQKEATVLQLKKQIYQEYLTAYGEIQNDNQIKLSFQTSGKVNVLKVEAGQYVQKGQVLVALDQTRQTNGTAQLQGEKEKANYALQNLYLEQTNATENLARLNKLLKEEVVTLEEKEQAALQLDLINNNIKTLEQNLKSIDGQLELSGFQTRLLTLRAPQNGIVEKVFLRKNESVQAGQEVIHFTPANNSAVVKLNLTAREVAQIAQGNTANIHIDYPKAKTYQGKVRSISYYRSGQKGDHKIIIDINAGKDKMIYGSLVKVEISTQAKQEGYKVPFDAVHKVSKDSVEILVLQADSVLQEMRFSYQQVNTGELLLNDTAHESLAIIVDKSIGLKALDKVQSVTYQSLKP